MITVRVIRSGGVAGITREWTILLDEDDWNRLLDEAPEPDRGRADRFVYRVRALHHEVVIPESRLEGPWRDLVERARSTD